MELLRKLVCFSMNALMVVLLLLTSCCGCTKEKTKETITVKPFVYAIELQPEEDIELDIDANSQDIEEVDIDHVALSMAQLLEYCDLGDDVCLLAPDQDGFDAEANKTEEVLQECKIGSGSF